MSYMKPTSINRTTVPVEGMFPMISDFPIYDDPDPKVAVLMRLFTQGNYAPLAQSFIPMILWSMRSLILNSDVQNYKPSIIFRCDQRLWDMGKEVFEKSGVPKECIIVYDPNLVPTELDNAIMHLAAAPFLDNQLERFERVIVLDGDLFALANDRTRLLPIMDVSMNKMPSDDISLLRSWTVWEPERDEYTNWYDHGQRGKEGFLKKTAEYCNSTPDIIESLMYPDDFRETPRPFHNGAYISIPMDWLLNNIEFRQFILDASGVMGNEEIALAVWGIKKRIETGINWPEHNLQDFSRETDLFKLTWEMDVSWECFKAGHPVWTHFFSYDNILTYASEWAKAIGGSDAEAHQFHDTIEQKVRNYQLTVASNIPRCHDNITIEHTMHEFQSFPLQDTEKSRQIATDIEAVCLEVAKDNRREVSPEYVIQHSGNELQALYEIVSRAHDSVHVDGHVLQCGLFCGGSALMMAHALRDDKTTDNPLLAIDSYTKDYRPLREMFDNAYHEHRENLWEFRLHEHITAALSDTVSYLTHFWQQPLRVAFIDSSHHYEPTKNELELILPHLVDGGWLILHDYFSKDTPGVQRALNECFKNQDTSHWTFYRMDELAIMQKVAVRTSVVAPTEESSKSAKKPRWIPNE